MSHGAHGTGGGIIGAVLLYAFVRLLALAIQWIHNRWEKP